MSTRPERPTPVQIPIYLVSELPEGTKVRHQPNSATITKAENHVSPFYVEVVDWPAHKVPWHQAFTERLPLVDLGGKPISSRGVWVTDAGAVLIRPDGAVPCNYKVVPADGMVTVHEPEPEPADTTDPLDELAPFVEMMREVWIPAPSRFSTHFGAFIDAWDRLRGDR